MTRLAAAVGESICLLLRAAIAAAAFSAFRGLLAVDSMLCGQSRWQIQGVYASRGFLFIRLAACLRLFSVIP